MVVHLVILHVILLLWPIRASSELSSPYSCGGVNIYYPFGIGEGCYLDKWFEITCDNSSGLPKPFLSSFKLELSDVQDSSDSGMRVWLPIISFNDNNKSTAKGVSLSGSPFYISDTHNRFAAIGCDKYAVIEYVNQQNDSKTGGCLSIITCAPADQHGGCYYFLCTIPPNRTFDNENISDMYSGLNIPQDCKFAFIVDQQWLESNFLSNPSYLKDIVQVPAYLEYWGNRKGRCLAPYSSDAVCNADGYCLMHLDPGHICVCFNRRHGNFYSGCIGDLYCNATGGHDCSKCPDGYKAPQHFYDQETECVPVRYTIDDMINKKSRVKLIMITVCSSVLGLLLLLIGAWWSYRFVKRRKAKKLKQKFFKRNGGLLLQQHLSSYKGNIEKTKLFTTRELEKATDNYNVNRILGQGGQGTVYKGMLSEGRIVAIKKSKMVDESKVEEFINEVVILSQINHRNVVQLLGCCLETEVPLLVYEFIPNGTLYQYIHDENEEFPITWELRLRIAIEVAGALAYLHSAASIPIYHRDVKSTNILLDGKYRAKISDFGTSRSITVDQTHLTTQVHGTFGYLDPEYFRSSQFTEKSDVYSFGVVLAELLTGQKPIRATNSEEDRSLAAYFLSAMKENQLFEVLDNRVLKEGKKEEIMAVANLTKRCLSLSGKKRPTMREVAIDLVRVGSGADGASTLQQICEEVDYADGEPSTCFAASSSFTDSYLDRETFSVDTAPLFSNNWTL